MLDLLQGLFGAQKSGKSARNSYEGARGGRRLRTWWPFDPAPQREHIQLPILRARSRDAARNNPIARAALERLVADIVGTGISPKPLHAGDRTRTQLVETWEAWSATCDADGQTDFYGLQTLALRAMLESGEALALLEPGDAAGVPLRIRLLESDHLAWKRENLPGGRRIVDGIELDAHGNRVAYWIHPRHPGDWDLSDNEPRRIEAARVLHLFEASRPGQLRGIPVLAPVLVRLKDLDEFDDAQLIRQKMANLFVGFITKPSIDPATPQLGPDNQPLDPDRANQPPLMFEPGMLQELAEGEDVRFSNPPGISENYHPFMRQQLQIVAAALGIPYPLLTGDFADANDRTMRVAINNYKRRCMALIRNVLVPKLCAPIRDAWVDAAILAGALPSNRSGLKLTRWTPQGWAYIHPVQDVQADVLAINNRLKSRSEALLERGYDAELIDREIAADQARERELGITRKEAARSGPARPAPAAQAAINAEAFKEFMGEIGATPEEQMHFLATLETAAARYADRPAPQVSVELDDADIAELGEEIARQVSTQMNGIMAMFLDALAKANISFTPEVHVAPAQVQIDAAQVEVKVDAVIPPAETPDIAVALPDRLIVTAIERNLDGDIINATQIETTLDPGPDAP